jgi:hypothetical protein
MKRGKTVIPFIPKGGWKSKQMFILFKKQEVGRKK